MWHGNLVRCSYLWSFRLLPDLPALDLVRASGEEVDQVHRPEPCRDDLRQCTRRSNLCQSHHRVMHDDDHSTRQQAGVTLVCIQNSLPHC